MTDGEQATASTLSHVAIWTTENAAWRDDLRLFALAYLAGFLFFLVLIG